MKEIGFGIIGCGGIASWHAWGVANTPGARLVAVSDIDTEKARKLGEENNAAWYTNSEELLANPEVDAVCICTPSGTHAKIGVQAARAGKHILTEKPMDVTLENADALIVECDKQNVKLGVIFQNRTFDGVRELRAIIKEGLLGKLVLGDAYIKWYRSQDYYDSAGWRGTWALDGGGALMNQGVHYIDLLQWMMGPVESVYAYTGVLARQRIEVEDTAAAVMKFANGAIGVIEGCTSSYPGVGAKLEIRGDRGTVCITDGRIDFAEILDWERPETVSEDTGGGSDDPKSIAIQGHRIQIQDFADAIREDRPPMVDGREGRKALEIILAIYQSARTGREVKLI